MPYILWFDEKKNVAYIQILAPLTAKDVEGVLETSNEIYKGSRNRYLLCDVTQITQTVRNRDAFSVAERMNRRYWDKIAFIGNDPITRMAAKIALAGPGKKHDSGFFKNTDSALAWLKRDNKKKAPSTKKKPEKKKSVKKDAE